VVNVYFGNFAQAVCMERLGVGEVPALGNNWRQGSAAGGVLHSYAIYGTNTQLVPAVGSRDS
jgi:hypothetical protein